MHGGVLSSTEVVAVDLYTSTSKVFLEVPTRYTVQSMLTCIANVAQTTLELAKQTPSERQVISSMGGAPQVFR